MAALRAHRLAHHDPNDPTADGDALRAHRLACSMAGGLAAGGLQACGLAGWRADGGALDSMGGRARR